MASFALFCGLGLGWALQAATRSYSKPTYSAAHIEDQQTGEDSNSKPGSDASDSGDFVTRLHTALGIRNRAARARAIAKLANGLGAAEIREALGRLERSRIPNRREIVGQLMSRWGEIDPLAAMDYAKGLPTFVEQREAACAALNGWLEHDLIAAEAWVTALPNGALKKAALTADIVAQAAVDPKHALAIARTNDLDWYSTQAIAGSIFSRWAMSDPQAAASETEGLPTGFLRTECQAVVAKQWAEHKPGDAIAWAMTLPDQIEYEETDFGMLTTRAGADRTNAANRVISIWLQRDANAALSWMAQLPEGPWKTSLLINACTFNMESVHDLNAVVQLADMFPAGSKGDASDWERRDGAFYYAARRLSQIDPDAVVNWLRELKDEHLRSVMLPGAIENLSGEPLLEALREAQARGGNGSEDLLKDVSRWRDPETAAKWAVSQPNGEVYLQRITASWVAKDPDRARDWIDTLPPTAKGDVLNNLFAGSLSWARIGSNASTIALLDQVGKWIPDLGDFQRQQAAYENLAREWLKIDAASARDWLESAPLSSEQKSALLNGNSAKD